MTDVASVNPSESVNLPTSSSNDRVSVTEPRRSKRRTLLSAFIVESIENLDVDVITEEFVSNFLVEGDPKNLSRSVKSIDAIF